MNPQQPGVAPPPSTNNPYDFIMSPPKPPKKGLFGGGGGNSAFIAKLIFITGGAIVLMIVVAILMNVVLGTKTNVADLTAITATQQELMRVAGEDKQAVSASVTGAALNTQLSIGTQQQKMFSYLAKIGTKVSNTILNGKKSATTDEQLQQANAANNFDTTYSQIMIQELQAYASQIKAAYLGAAASSKNEKSILATDYQQTQLLLKQWSAAEQTIATQ